jgi:excisionase family DNA binding protein
MKTGNAKHAIHLIDLTADHYFGERQLMIEDRLLYSRAEVARLLCISARSVDYLVAENRLSSVKLGRRRLFTRHALENFAGVEVRGRMAL